MLDPIKLDWMNGEYIKKMSIDDLYKQLEVYLKEYNSTFYEENFAPQDRSYNTKIVAELQNRMKRFDEFVELTSFFYT